MGNYDVMKVRVSFKLHAIPTRHVNLGSDNYFLSFLIDENRKHSLKINPIVSYFRVKINISPVYFRRNPVCIP